MENDTIRFAVINVEGSYLVKIKAIFDSEQEANDAKLCYPHIFGTHVYPVSLSSDVAVGKQITRNKEFET